MMRTPVALLLNTPIAISSAMIAASVSAVVSPGTATMSSPTEQTALMLSSRSIDSAPARAAATMPASSLTGMNAPDSPPTADDAITPPFFTASVSIASAADRSGRARLLDPHRLQDLRDGIADGGRGRQRQIDDAEADRRSQPRAPPRGRSARRRA